jgi:hypothetical protein
MDFHINEAMLTVIAGALTWGVKIGASAVATIKELNLKIAVVIDTIKDHESRLRVVENNKSRRT